MCYGPQHERSDLLQADDGLGQTLFRLLAFVFILCVKVADLDINRPIGVNRFNQSAIDGDDDLAHVVGAGAARRLAAQMYQQAVDFNVFLQHEEKQSSMICLARAA